MRSHTHRRATRLDLVQLEDRCVPASLFTVDSTADTSNPGGTVLTLREALLVERGDVSLASLSAAEQAQIQSNAPGLAVDTIQFSAALAGQTITFTSSDTSPLNRYGATGFVVTTEVTIDGSAGGSGQGVTISGGGTERLFAVTATGDLTLSNLTLTGGLAQGGAGYNGGGGGAGLGGAVFVDQGTLVVSGSTLDGNQAVGGAGTELTLGVPNLSVNWSSGYGGGGGGLASATSVNGGGPNGGAGAVGNESNGGSGGFGGGGGGGYGPNSGSPLVNSGTGGAGGFGGGGGAAGFETKLVSNPLENGINASTSYSSGGAGGFGGGAGAGEVYGSMDTPGFGGGGFTDFSIGGGGGGGLGGAVFSNDGNVTVIDSTLTANAAIGGTGSGNENTTGGSILFSEPGAGNGSAYGGALFSRNGTLTVVSSTLSANTAGSGGTDVYVLADNVNGGGGDTANTGAASLTLTDSILGQTGTGVSDLATGTNGTGTAVVANGSNNLIRSTTVTAVGNLSTADPQLGPLQNNGGSTPTMAPLPGSPAIDVGSATDPTGLVVDQRGYARVVNGLEDIGAVENQVVPEQPLLFPTTVPGGGFELGYSVTMRVFGRNDPNDPYNFTISEGSLPPGLILTSTGSMTATLSGIPTAGGTYSFTVTATDGVGDIASQAYSVAIAPPVVVEQAALPDVQVGTAYSQTLAASGPVGPFTFTVTGGALPVGLTLSTAGILSGTPTVAGPSTFTVTATAPDGQTGTGTFTVIVNPPIIISPSSLSMGQVGTPYSQALTAAGAVGSVTFAVTAGSLPAGLTLSAAGVLSGIPTTSGSAAFTVTATDSDKDTGAQAYVLTVAPIVVGPATLPSAQEGEAYYQTLAASGPVGPFTFAVTTGALPAGLELSTAGVLTGTPTTAGTATFTITATDPNGDTGTQAYTLTIAPIVVGPATLSPAQAGAVYDQTLTASGPTGPFTFAVTTGALPAGLVLSTAGILSGTPTTTGPASFTITATDSDGDTGTQAYTLTVAGTPVLPDAQVGVAYSQTLSQPGPAGPFTFEVTAGSLPVGLTLSADGALSGTPTTAGTTTFTVTATDPNGFTKTLSETLTVDSVVVGPVTLPPSQVGVSYSQELSVTGPAGPFTFAVTAGSLPTGLMLSAAGVLYGIPTTAETTTFTVTATDPNGGVGNQSYQLTVGPIVISPATLSADPVGMVYSQGLTASGPAGPFTFAVTGGALPAGLTLSTAGVLSGTPTTADASTFTITATDPNGDSGTQTYTVGSVAVGPGTLPVAQVEAAYTQTLTASGPAGPFTFAVTAGSLPTGLSLSSAGQLSGSPTVTGTFAFTVTATSSGGMTGSTVYLLAVVPAVVVAPSSLPAGTAETAYSQTITASGPAGPFTFAVTSGSLPAGLTLSATGILSGTPIAAGTFTFTVTAAYAGTLTGSQSYTLQVSGPTIVFDPTSLPVAEAGQQYSQAISASGAAGPFTFAITAGSLPTGLALMPVGSLTGTPVVGGVFPFTVTATSADGFSATQAYSLTVYASSLVVTSLADDGSPGTLAAELALANADPTPEPIDISFAIDGTIGPVGPTPVSFWSGNGTAADATGANNGVLINGATYAPGQDGEAFSFNGGTSAVQMSTTALGGAYSALTMDAWIDPYTEGSESNEYGLTVLSRTDGDGFALRLLGGYLQADLRLTSGDETVTFPAQTTPIPLNTWTNIAVTYDGSVITGYINGQSVGTVAASGTIRNGDTSTTLMIGNEPAISGIQTNGAGFAWDGLIQDVGFYSQALTAAQIQSIEATGTIGTQLEISRTSGPVTIDGTGHTVTLNGGDLSRIIQVDAGVTATLDDLTLTDGTGVGSVASGDGGAIESAGTLTLTSMTLQGNTASEGGAVYSTGNLTVVDSTIDGNAATNSGGGIDQTAGGTLTIQTSTVSGNSAAQSGGGVQSAGPVTVMDSTVTGNLSGIGGGIDTQGGASVAGSIVSGNTLSQTGGVGPDVAGGVMDGGYNLFGTALWGVVLGTGDVFSDAPGVAPLADNGGPTETMALLSGSLAIDAGNPADTSTDQRGVAIQNGRRDIGAFELVPSGPGNPNTVSPTNSTVTVSSGTVASGNIVTVTLQAEGAAGNMLATGGATVFFALGSPTSGQGMFSAVTDNGNGTYTATFAGTTAGTNTITATINGSPVTSTLPNITVTPGAVSLAKSIITLASGSVQAGSSDLVTLQAEDAYGNDITTGGLTISFGLDSGTGWGTFGPVTDNNNGTYTAYITGSIAGSNTITTTIGGNSATSTTPTVTVTPGTVSLAESVVTLASGNVLSRDTDLITLTTRDAYGNAITTGGLTVAFGLGNGVGQGTFSTVTDNGNGTYTAIFTGTAAGTNTIMATIGGSPATSTAPTLTVASDTASLATSLVTVAQSTGTAGTGDQVTLQAKDADGNNLTTGGLAVLFTLVNATGGQGSFGTVTDNGNGTYSATFTGTLAGTNAISATIGGNPIATTAAPITVVPGTATLANSYVTLASGSVASGNTDLITLHAVDAYGNPLTTGGLNVDFSLGSRTETGSFGSFSDDHNGTYTELFTGIFVGTNTITGFIDGQALTTTAPPINVTPGSLDPANALVTLSAGSVTSGSSLTVTVQTRDAAGNDLTSGGATVALALGSGNGQGSFSTVTDSGNGTYTATFMGTVAGTNTIMAVIDDQAVTAPPPMVSVTPGGVDPANSLVILAAPEIQLDGVDSITLQSRDAYGNDVDANNFNVAFAIENTSGAKGTISKVKNNENGTYTASFTGTSDGSNIIEASVNGVPISSSAPVTVAGGAFSPAESTLKVESSTITAGTSTTVTLQVFYPKNNPELTGGLSVTFKLGSSSEGQGTFSSVTDNQNGTYTATFTGTLAGTNTIKAFIDGEQVTSAAAFTVTKGSLSLAKSTVVTSSASVSAGNKVTVTLQPEDAGGNKLNLNGLNVAFALGSGSGQGTFSVVTENKNGTYTATFSGTLAGTNTILAMIGGQAVTSTSPSINVTPGQVSLSNSAVSVSSCSLEAGSSATVTLLAKDAFGNTVMVAQTVAFGLVSTTGAKGVFGSVKNNKNGSYTVTFTGTLAGTNAITAAISGHKVTSTAPAIAVTPGALSLAKSVVTLSAARVSVGNHITVTLQAEDAYGNKETVGGLIVVFALRSTKGGQGAFGSVMDNNNGTYTVTFTGTTAGTNYITATINETIIASTAPSITIT